MAGKLLLGVVLAKFPTNSAGHVCAVMGIALGFREAGWDVFLVENLHRKDLAFPAAGGPSIQDQLWRRTVAEFGFMDRQCLLLDGLSPERDAMLDFAGGADLFLNFSGQFDLVPMLPQKLRKAYLDVDPAFTQIWAEVYGCNMNFACHDVFLSVGLRLAEPEVSAPRCGLNWQPFVHPVPASYWNKRLAGLAEIWKVPEAWTTVAHWYGYNEVAWQGLRFGNKRDSLLKMINLPAECPDCRFGIATDLQPEWGDYEDFVAAGWKFHPAAAVCRDVDCYLAFLAGSRGEIGIAKAGYINSNCGWMSDRSLMYLALGKPVVLQETGWSELLPSGAGLLPFVDAASAAAAIRQIEENYSLHTAAATNLVETVFAPERAVSQIVETCGL